MGLLAMTLRFDDRVAIVTGAGGGLGRAYALDLARRGAKVVVNDLGGARDGSGSSLSAAQTVVDEITAMGGEAMANGASVTDAAAVEKMVAVVKERWGRIDILINNAGILRDKTFVKMSHDDFRQVLDVHLMGSVNCTKAVWEIMREQAYGRILMTTSSTGLYGNFGQANYGAAKLGLVGLMKTLVLEGAKYNVKLQHHRAAGGDADDRRSDARPNCWPRWARKPWCRPRSTSSAKTRRPTRSSTPAAAVSSAPM